MDVRRIELWDGRYATLLDNDLVHLLVEDCGGTTLEFSALNFYGGRENVCSLPPYRGFESGFDKCPNPSWYRSNPSLYYDGGARFCFPNYGPSDSSELRNGYSSSCCWSVSRYGMDSMTGGVWLLSTLDNEKEKWTLRRLDLLLPYQSVRYTATTLVNRSDAPISGNAVWSNCIGSPFLESGCLLNSCAETWMTAPGALERDRKRHFAEGVQFDSLTNVPVGGGKTVDYTVIPSPNGYTDCVTGRVPRQSRLGWSSIINPRHRMIYFCFFPGPGALEDEDEIGLNFLNYQFCFGGADTTPYAFYKGGTDQHYVLDMGAGINLLDLGRELSLEKQTLMGADTLATIEPGEQKCLYYATLLQAYKNPRIGLNFYTVEPERGGILIKRTKSGAHLACEPDFRSIRKFRRKIEENL